MKVAAILAAAGMVGVAIYYTTQAAQAGQVTTDYFAPQDNPLTGAIDSMKSQLKNAMADPAQSVKADNVRAFLMLIRTGEGTRDPAGYSRLFGGKQFSSFADHPRPRVPFGNTYSSAAGAYQFLSGTWDEMAAKYNLQDFSPASQDIAAVGLIKRRGALGDVEAGRFKTAIEKCNKEWASLPGSPYGQPTLTNRRAADILASLGVITTESIA